MRSGLILAQKVYSGVARRWAHFALFCRPSDGYLHFTCISNCEPLIRTVQSWAVRVTYAINMEDFRALIPPFTLRAGRNAAFKAAMVACTLMGLLGVYGLAQGYGIAFGGFLIGLGAFAAAAAYFFEVRSVQKARRKYETSVSEGYQRLHCPQDRAFEADDKGYTLSCKCKSLGHPWSELTRISENKTHFLLGTKMDVQAVPKSAFPSESDRTEFRAFLSARLGADNLGMSPHIDFIYQRADYLRAYFLNVLKGGGWRRVLKNLALFACIVYAFIRIWVFVGPPNDIAVRCGLIGAFLALSLPRIKKLFRKLYLGPQRIYFSEENLHIQNPETLARSPWGKSIGYLENDNLLLLYYPGGFYRPIPKRALTGRGTEFCTLVRAKLPPYDYRKRVASAVHS